MTRRGAPVSGVPRLIGVIDLGKSACRLRVFAGADATDPVFETTGEGAPGLAESRGVTVAVDAVQRVLAGWPQPGRDALVGLSIGAAGTEAAPKAARNLADRLRKTTGCPVVVASDVVIAHAGAFRGAPGTVLVAGTGAVALGLDTRGQFAQTDGWGPWLGDTGSGRWIGQQGLQAALRSADGRGAPTTLLDAMRGLIGSPHDVPGWVDRTRAPARTLATFAQVVLQHAQHDAVAADIVERAVDHLASTARAAATADGPVVLTGGLAGDQKFAARLILRLTTAGLSVVEPRGTALHGAHLIAVRTDLPYERKVFRGP